MTFGSLFSGIEGFGLGLTRNGMECVWQAEKDANCLAVLKRHFPDVKRYTDVRKIKRSRRPDLICGGFPCQDLSVAGRRAGLAGKRSGLWSEFHRILVLLTPTWVLIENVPGLLSSGERRDMGTILRGLGDVGYRYAYRVLDSQWFGLAQRRKRVFIVGCLGDVRRAAQVLFERESLPWDTPTRGEEGEGSTRAIAPCIRGSGPGTQRVGDSRGQDCLITAPLTGNPYGDHESRESLLVAHTLNSRNNRIDGESQTFVAHTLRSEGHDASEDGTGRGVPLVAMTLRSRQHSPGVSAPGRGGEDDQNLIVQPIVFDERNITSKANRSTVEAGKECHTLHSSPPTIAGYVSPRACRNSDSANEIGIKDGHVHDSLQSDGPGAVVFSQKDKQHGQFREILGAAETGDGSARPREDEEILRDHHEDGRRGEAFTFQTRIARNGRGQPKAIADALTSSEGGSHADSKPHVAVPSGVRRLTPVECERLQGFPDGYTAGHSDSARYRMLGNAVSVPVAQWLGRRIMEAQ